jgi:quinohemoprotein amine dehydrogenase
MRFLLALIVATTFLSAQGGQRGAGPAAANAAPSEPGIPVSDGLVKAKCGTCHRADEKSNLTRISWERTTPEGWQQIVKRMVRLNGLQLSPEEARNIVASLSETHGLAPEEFKPVAWFAERRAIHSEGIANEALRDACASCHPLARPKSWRRSREEWELLISMHRGMFPVVENTSFRRPAMPGEGGGAGLAAARPTLGGGGGGGGRSADAAPAVLPGNNNPQVDPAELAVSEFSKTNGLHSPEWASWQAARRELKIAGRWLVRAWLPGKGRYVGEMLVTATGPTAFTTKTTLTSLKTGEQVAREGRGVVYTGYAWRGRSKAGQTDEKEVLSFSRDQMSADGRWFWGGYDEFGYDVHLERAGGPVLLTTDVTAIKKGATGATVKIYGDGFPAKVTPADLDFGGGVKVTAVTATPTLLTATVTVEPSAVAGKRDLTLGRATLPGALAIYDKVDYLKLPESAVARLGGNTHPKGFYQFEAFAWSNGLDGKKGTGDDFELMAVDAKFSMEEFPSHLGDDDKEYVGSLSVDGLFTPNIEGPNEKRRFGTNNYGDVWVTATWSPESAQKLMAKSYLIVAVPLYIRWDGMEGSN